MGAQASPASAESSGVNTWGDLTHLPGAGGERTWSLGDIWGHRLQTALRRRLGLLETVSCTSADCPACNR